jgi:hypothetical protein
VSWGRGLACTGETEERKPGEVNRKQEESCRMKYNTTENGSFQAVFATFLKVFSILAHKYMPEKRRFE